MNTVLNVNHLENLAFLKLIKEECINELKALDIPFDESANVKLRKHRKSSFGICHRRYNGNLGYNYTIEINESLISLCLENKMDLNAIKHTLLHEYIHTIDGCFNHKAKWLRYVNMLNKEYGYNIKRCSSYEERNIDKDSLKMLELLDNDKYVVQCMKCGAKIKRARKSKLITHTDCYRCGCGGRLKRIK